jgi:diguanylate cyclase (GGDEF)-like protein/PAS domain S-box-containing protein
MAQHILTRKPAYSAEKLAALALVLLGGMTVFGWVLRIPAMVEIRHGLVPMVFNTGLCFLLSGIGLLLGTPDTARLQRIRTGIGAFLAMLCSLTLLEHVFDRSLGIDMAFLHAWFDYGNTRPGRMAPNTAAGFISIGLTYLLLHRVDTKKTAFGIVTLTFCTLGIGLTGLVGYLLAPDLLFGWARSARMAVHTASGFILCAIGLWLSWSKAEWYAGQRFFGEDGKVRFLSAAILIVVTTTVGLTGFVLLQEGLQRTLESRLESVMESRGPWVNAITSEVARDALSDLRLTGVMETAARLAANPRDKQAAGQFDTLAQHLVAEGYSGLTLEDVNRQAVLESRKAAGAPAFIAPLTPDGMLELGWDQHTFVRVRVAIDKEGGLAGYVRIDKVVPALEAPLFSVAKLGSTAELAACIRREQRLVCLPNNRNSSVFSVELKDSTNPKERQKTPLPMELALAGKTGIVYTLDYRNQNVIAAYGEIAPGLGFVAKQDAKEAYGVIRNALMVGVPIILVISLLGALTLYSQLDPIVTRMRRSEQEADDAAIQTRTIMEAVGEGIMTIDRHSIIQSANEAVCEIFGYNKSELIGRNVSILIPADMRGAHARGVARAAEGGPPRLLGKPNVQIDGLRKNGAHFPLEITINAVPLSGQTLFVGVMRDITERKELEEKLARLAQYDTLTGLPNRALFMDRLDTALLRARRSNGAVALMFIDLDGFKEINDTFGHQGGDELLVQVAQRLAASVRKSDSVARLAGDEFTIILEDLASPDYDAKAVAAKVITAMRAPFKVRGEAATVTASVGLVIHDVRIGDVDSSELLRHADEQMYGAKQAGKNMVSAKAL